MAVDFTKLFTIVGKYLDKLNDNYAIIATHNTEQEAIEDILIAQDEVRLVDGLDTMYDGFRSNVASWVQNIINRISGVLTDPELVTDQYSFGTTPSIQTVLARMIKDMAANDKNVTTSTMTTGAITRTVTNAEAGYMVVGTKLDGATPPMSGAIAIPEYSGLTSLLYPDDETITLTCSQDSEHGAQRGAERFNVTGTGAASAPYSVTGENLGSAGTLTTADNMAETYASNPSFDIWDATAPDQWTVETGDYTTDFVKSNSVVLYQGQSIVFGTSDNAVTISQILNAANFVRGKAYFLSVWTRRNPDGGDGTTEAYLSIGDGGGTYLSLTLTPTASTLWTLYSGQFIIPNEVEGDITLLMLSPNTGSKDGIYLDQIVITPCFYVAGIAMAVFGGKQKFLNGDTFSIRLQNNNTGKLLTYFRKAYRVMLPVDATPTISDSLVA